MGHIYIDYIVTSTKRWTSKIQKEVIVTLITTVLQYAPQLTFLQYVGKPEPGPVALGPHTETICPSPVLLYMTLSPRFSLQADW